MFKVAVHNDMSNISVSLLCGAIFREFWYLINYVVFHFVLKKFLKTPVFPTSLRMHEKHVRA